MKNKLLIVFALTVGVVMTSITAVKADQTNVKSNVHEKTDKYDMLDSKGKLDLNGTSLIEEKMKEISEQKGRQPDVANDAYFKITTVYKNKEERVLNKNAVVKSIEKFSKDEYLIEKDKKDFKLATYSALEEPPYNTTENSWIRITNNGFKRNADSYDVYSFFEWLKRPLFTMKDVMSLSTNSNGRMDYSNSRGQVEYLMGYLPNPVAVDEYYPLNNYDKFQSSMTGFAYIFNLREVVSGSNDVYSYLRGYMSGVHKRVNSTVTEVPFAFTYAHSQYNLSVTPSVSFKEVSVSISPTFAFDKIELPLYLPY